MKLLLALLFAPLFAFSQSSVWDSLEVYWPFDQFPPQDTSGGISREPSSFFTSQTEDRNGNSRLAILLDGADALVNCPFTFNYPNTTYAMWFKWDSSASGMNFLMENNHVEMTQGGALIYLLDDPLNPNPRIFFGQGSTIWFAPIEKGIFYLVTMSIDQDSVRCYLNNNKVLTLERTYGHSANQNLQMRLGVDHDTEQLKFKGTIDDVMIFSKALTPTDIDSIFNQPINGINKFSEVKMEVYPNPSQGQVILTGKGNLFITDLKGNVIYKEEKPTYPKTLSLPSGTYFVTVGDKVKKVIVK